MTGTRGDRILGVGIDLVENDRMRDMLGRWGDTFKKRAFLDAERDYCDSRATPYRHYAARFAVKEAVSKAFGTGVGPHLGLLDVEVTRNARTGEPAVKLRGAAAEMAEKRGVSRIMVSLSHTRDTAIAQVLIVGDA